MKHRFSRLTRRLFFGIGILVIIITIGIFTMVRALYAFQQALIIQQQEQMLTVAKSVSSSISIYAKGYLSDITVLRNSSEFVAGYQQLRNGGSATPLRVSMQNYIDTRFPTVTGLCLLDNAGKFITGTTGTFSYELTNTESLNRQLLLLKNEDGYSIGISIPVYQRYWLVCLLNVNEMYQRIGSDIRLGKKGYITITTSDGVILMHPSADQVGLTMIEDRKRLYPSYDLSELEAVFENQRAGKTGVETYHSYWWSDPSSNQVEKIIAYTPVWLQNDFLVVSAIADYQEVVTSFHTSMNRIFLIAMLTLCAFGLLTALLIYLLRSRHSYELENQTLREVNSALEELHQKEEQIQHSQRLQTIGTLTGGIAHEFNNLLTPIMGYSGILLESAEPNSKQQEDLEEIYHSAEKAKELIQQITTLSRKNVGHAFRMLPLQPLIADAAKMARSILPPNIKMETLLSFGQARILGNETQLTQVVLNLCANAFHAIGGKPDGRFSITGVVVDSEQLPTEMELGSFEQFARLTFYDNGHGIEERLLERVFDPFFTTKKAGEGTGLGLSIAQSIVEGHGGRIFVESKAGLETTFTVYLPVNTAQSTEKESRSEGSTQEAFRETVVVVDNDPRTLHLLERSLMQQGFQVAGFVQPKEALSYLKQHDAAALVTDYSMPEILGTQLALTARSFHSEIRIILLTGQIKLEIIEAKQKGILNDYLLKPAASDLIAQRLSELLR